MKNYLSSLNIFNIFGAYYDDRFVIFLKKVLILAINENSEKLLAQLGILTSLIYEMKEAVPLVAGGPAGDHLGKVPACHHHGVRLGGNKGDGLLQHNPCLPRQLHFVPSLIASFRGYESLLFAKTPFFLLAILASI